ncbi:DUF6236 family protein [Streptomyces sp. NBC_01431]|uniref:DUF6236 family protein n=1 Tax=Streptomyces sp. NBC_01431 TaxID=2903863 RepID=UPI003FCD29C9
MSFALRHQLIEAGLAVQVDEHDPWVGLHPRLGTVCLTALADTVARHNTLSPVTDDPGMHHAVGALDRLADLIDLPVTPALQDTRAAYAQLSLRAVIRPERIASVPVVRLLSFRQRYASELAAFHTHIGSLAAELEQIAAVENSESPSPSAGAPRADHQTATGRTTPCAARVRCRVDGGHVGVEGGPRGRLRHRPGHLGCLRRPPSHGSRGRRAQCRSVYRGPSESPPATQNAISRRLSARRGTDVEAVAAGHSRLTPHPAV